MDRVLQFFRRAWSSLVAEGDAAEACQTGGTVCRAPGLVDGLAARLDNLEASLAAQPGCPVTAILDRACGRPDCPKGPTRSCCRKGD